VSVGTVIPSLQAATGLLMAPGGLLEPSVGTYLLPAVAQGLVVGHGAVAALAQLEVVAGAALGLGITTVPPVSAVVNQAMTAWALGLSRPGLANARPDLPPVPPLSPADLIALWEFHDAVLGVSPEVTEPADISHSDSPVPTRAKAKEPVDISFSDASP
jgi:hypothetical protein